MIMRVLTKLFFVTACVGTAPAFAQGTMPSATGAEEATEATEAKDTPAAVPPAMEPGVTQPLPASSAPGTVTQSALSKKVQFQGAFDDRLSAMDDKIDRFKDRAGDADVAADPAVSQALVEAEARFAAAEARLKAFKDMKVDGWEAHKQGLEQAFEEADKAVMSAEQSLAAH